MPIDYTGFAFPKGKPRAVEQLEKRRAAKQTERTVRNKVNSRDKQRCFFPRCQERAFHKHHKVYRSRGGKWETENIVSGCALHHRWAHAGLIRLIGNPDIAPVEVELTTLGKQAKIRLPTRIKTEESS